MTYKTRGFAHSYVDASLIPKGDQGKEWVY